MRYILNVNCDNAAFGEDDYDRCMEVGKILERLAWSALVDLQGHVPIFDSNGNRVGEARFVEDQSNLGTEEQFTRDQVMKAYVGLPSDIADAPIAEQCGEKEDNYLPMVCTRHRNHKGVHLAAGRTRIVAAW